MTWYVPPAILAALRGYQPSAGTGLADITTGWGGYRVHGLRGMQ
jgi:hypothetical protein